MAGFEWDQAGDVTVDAALLARRFGMPVAAFHRLMGQGRVHGRVELGDGEDAGRRRVALRCGNRVWQAVLDTEGQVESEQMRHVPGRPPVRQGG
ncbi:MULTISPECIES: DUF6522 family protein [Bosea]|jgi:hypothetical protein|uniref:Uncharacterized protein n=1 Tax=Bosea vaviloviae TaxID=1526658 RepID=A0A0N1N282_9HYPH|nr:DUF6522 family protein [Bosea vaviloviae]KPH80376.1 hypothetical protein AE618_13710 [Bosea vaviloviae]